MTRQQSAPSTDHPATAERAGERGDRRSRAAEPVQHDDVGHRFVGHRVSRRDESARAGESLCDVGQEVGRVLEADGDPQQAVGDSG